MAKVWRGGCKGSLEEQRDPREEPVFLAGQEDKIRQDKPVVIVFPKGRRACIFSEVGCREIIQ